MARSGACSLGVDIAGGNGSMQMDGAAPQAQQQAVMSGQQIRSRRVVIGEVGSQEPLEVTFVQDDDVIEAVTAYGADQALDRGILPRRARGAKHLFDTEAVHTATEPEVIDVVAIAQERPRGFVPWKCLDHLLCRPLARGVLGDIEVTTWRRSCRSTRST